MRRNKRLRWAAACAALLLLCFALCGCTAQSVPIGRRAMVRLIYLETAGDGYRALTVVCDFGTGEESAGAATVQTAQAPTLSQALQQAAGAQGGSPFFAQNRLLLLGPKLARTHLRQTLEFFAQNSGAYRDPAVWLWRQGEEALLRQEDPMALVRQAESLTAQDAEGCALHVLETDPQADCVVVPVLRLRAAADDSGCLLEAAGLGVFAADEQQLYTDPETLQGYGLLRGRRKSLTLAVECGGRKIAVQLEGLTRHLTAQQGMLMLQCGGTANAAAQGEPLPPPAALQTAVERQVTELCTVAWQRLTQEGRRDALYLEWWAQQLGTAAQPLAVQVSIRLNAAPFPADPAEA